MMALVTETSNGRACTVARAKDRSSIRVGVQSAAYRCRGAPQLGAFKERQSTELYAYTVMISNLGREPLAIYPPGRGIARPHLIGVLVTMCS